MFYNIKLLTESPEWIRSIALAKSGATATYLIFLQERTSLLGGIVSVI